MTAGQLTYARESLMAIKDEMAALMAAHWAEVAHDRDTRELDPDWEAFAALDQAGQLYTLAVRSDGALAGYLVAIVRRHLHARKTLTAYVDAVYLSPAARRGLAGARFLRHADRALAALGAEFIYWHVKRERDFRPLLERAGYHHVEDIMGRAVTRVGG